MEATVPGWTFPKPEIMRRVLLSRRLIRTLTRSIACIILCVPKCTFGSALNQTLDIHVRASHGYFETLVGDINKRFSKSHNNASRVSLAGSYAGKHATPFYGYVAGLDASEGEIETTRFISVIGVTSVLGEMQYGRASTPYKSRGLYIDPFYDTAAGVTNAGNNFGLSDLTRGFSDRSLLYFSPESNRVRLNLGLIGLGGSSAESIGFEFSIAGFNIGAQYMDVGNDAAVANSKKDEDAYRIHAKYDIRSWSIGFSVEEIERVERDQDERYGYASISGNISDKTRLAASLGVEINVMNSFHDGRAVDGDGLGYSIGALHKIFTWLEVYSIYSRVEYDGIDVQKSCIIGLSIHHRLGK